MNPDTTLTATEAPKEVFTVSQNWLDFANNASDTVIGTVTTNQQAQISNYAYITPWNNWTLYSVRIVLKLSEVEHLRKICKNNARLKEILNRFTPYIEVQVDF